MTQLVLPHNRRYLKSLINVTNHNAITYHSKMYLILIYLDNSNPIPSIANTNSDLALLEYVQSGKGVRRFDTPCMWARVPADLPHVRSSMTNSPGSMARKEPRERFMASVVSLPEGRRSMDLVIWRRFARTDRITWSSNPL